jgi:hypothetical protein
MRGSTGRRTGPWRSRANTSRRSSCAGSPAAWPGRAEPPAADATDGSMAIGREIRRARPRRPRGAARRRASTS